MGKALKPGLARVSLVVAALALAHQLGAAEADLSQVQQNLRQIKQKKIQAQKEFKGQLKTERHILKDLSVVNQKLDLARRDEKTYRHNLAIVRARLEELNRKDAAYSADIARERGLLKKELVSLYKSGPLGGVKLLLSSRNPYELISRYHTLKTLARHDTARIALAKASMEGLEQGRAENLRLEANYRASKKGAEFARLSAAREKKRRENFLGTVRLKKSSIQRMIKELDSADLRLQEFVARQVEEQRHSHRRVGVELDHGPSRLGRRHSLPWPVRGKVLSRFGQQQHPIFNTTIFNRGIEIAAPLGAAVKAVAAGAVRYADEFEGYGQMVILDHGGGYFTVYGHNSALTVKEGDSVVQGQTIAEVGDSSTLRRSALYFEIRALAKAVDPFIWLAR